MGAWSATICESLTPGESFGSKPAAAPAAAPVEQQWPSAIAAITELLIQTLQPTLAPGPRAIQGILLAGPVPCISDPAVATALDSWIFANKPVQEITGQLPPAPASATSYSPQVHAIPVLPGDPISTDQFCLILTPKFSFVAAVGNNLAGQPACQFSFAPEAVLRVWEMLRLRILLARSAQDLERLEALVQQVAPREPPYQLVMQFSQLLLQAIGAPRGAATSPLPSAPLATPAWKAEPLATTVAAQPCRQRPDVEFPASLVGAVEHRFDVELLQAIAHEVRTPLTTISTLIRLLLKRSDLPAEVLKRLETIHRECGEQIDRFGLIFRAMELEQNQAKQIPIALGPVSLAQVFADNIPRWQNLAARRNLTLEVFLPPQLPTVVSDPTMLDQVLTGVIDRFAHSLSPGSQIQIEVSFAGEQLKLQVRSQSPARYSTTQKYSEHLSPFEQVAVPVLKSVGQLLMLQPETGNLSLSLPVTKNLFQALGGKLTVRTLPQQGEILTIFLPLGCD